MNALKNHDDIYCFLIFVKYLELFLIKKTMGKLVESGMFSHILGIMFYKVKNASLFRGEAF